MDTLPDFREVVCDHFSGLDRISVHSFQYILADYGLHIVHDGLPRGALLLTPTGRF